MKKSLILALALIFMLGITGAAFAAQAPTYVDLPAKHWAYDAVAYLSQVGIVDGYNDKTFRGDKTMTRYEMAQIVYKAMLNQAKANIAQKALIDKLASEFALEMNKVETMDKRLTKVESNMPNLKLTGEIMEQYQTKVLENKVGKDWGQQKWRFRLNGTAKVDDNTTAYFRVANPTMTGLNYDDSGSNYAGDFNLTGKNSFAVDRFYGTTKLGAMKFSWGRIPLVSDSKDLITDSGLFSYDGGKINWSWGDLNFDAKRGVFARNLTSPFSFGYGYAPGFYSTTKAPFASLDHLPGTSADTYYANMDVNAIGVSSKSGDFNWALGWIRFTNQKLGINLPNYTYAEAGYQFSQAFRLDALYGKNSQQPVGPTTKPVNSEGGGAFWLVQGVFGDQVLNAAGKQNVTVAYLKAGTNSVNGLWTSFDQPDEASNNGTNGSAWTDLDMAYRYAFSPNMVIKGMVGLIKDKQIGAENWKVTRIVLTYKF